MAAKLTFFSVDNGDMSLITLDNGKTILIDCRIRATDGDDPPPDVASQLKERLKKDAKGRYYVDAFLLSHPDEDHCLGLEDNFHLGPPEDFPEKKEKIFIRQLWSSPLVFRRASKDHTLCDDAKAFNTEARRRVQKYRDTDGKVSDGDRILILGEDEDPKKQEGLDAIVVKADTAFNTLNGASDTTFSAYLLAPQPKSDDEEEEEIRTKNNSSVILQFTIGVGKKADACKFLTGGDAGVAIWERLWARHKKNPEYLVYDVLLTPHHCSWHTLSYDSISDKGEDAEVSKDDKSALSQTRKYARLIASCKKIKDDNDDPPSHRAAEEYRAIAKKAEGSFDETSNFDGEPLELDITEDGPSLKKARRQKGGTTSGSGAIGGSVLGHG